MRSSIAVVHFTSPVAAFAAYTLAWVNGWQFAIQNTVPSETAGVSVATTEGQSNRRLQATVPSAVRSAYMPFFSSRTYSMESEMVGVALMLLVVGLTAQSGLLV